MNSRYVVLTFFLIFGIYKVSQHFQNKKLQVQMASMQNTKYASSQYGIPNSCSGKKYCITAFVAPWCPACKQAQGTFRHLHNYLEKNNHEVGFGIVVGAGTPDQNKAEQEVLAPTEVILDNNGIIFKNRQISSYPTYIVNDLSGKEITKKEGSPVINDENLVPTLLSQFFGI